MCGIAGVYSLNFGQPERELFESLLMLNVFRGRDSTGVVRINDIKKGQTIASIKRAVTPSPAFITSKFGSEFLWDLDKKEAKDNSKTIGFLGHCRAATQGAVKVQNAHPFRFDHTIGVHNGTIRGEFEGRKEFETDSEALYALVNEAGIEEALNEVNTSALDVAYALAWVDTKDKTLNFIKNSRRPLYFTYVYAKSTLLWSSESEMIEFSLNRRSTKLSKTSWAPDVGKDGYFTLSDNHLLTIPLGKAPSEATLKGLNIKKRATYYSGYSGHWNDWETYGETSVVNVGGSSSDGYDNFREKHGSEGLSSLPWLLDEQEKGKETGTSGTSSSSSGNDSGAASTTITQFRANQHKGEPVTESERNFRLSVGCFCCGASISPSDYAEIARVHWWNREHYACGDCYDNKSGETDWVAIAIDNEFDDSSNLSTIAAAGSVH